MSDWWWAGWLGFPPAPFCGYVAVHDQSLSPPTKRQRNDESSKAIRGLLVGLPLVYQVRSKSSRTRDASVEFIDGTVMHLTGRLGGRTRRVASLAHRSGICLDRARCLPGRRRWLLRFRSLAGEQVTVIAGIDLHRGS